MKLPSLSAKWRRILAALLLAAAGAGGYWLLHRGEVSTDDAAVDGRIVTISPKVAGYVREMNLRDNQAVKAGDVLLKIDPTDYLLRRDKARAALLAAKAAAAAAAENAAATGVAAPATAEAAAAAVRSAVAAWEKSRADRDRAEQLFAAGAAARQQLDLAVAAEKTDRAALEKLQADLRSAATAPRAVAAARSTARQLEAQVRQAEAELAQAEAELADTVITAPLDGRIAKRSAEQGAYVQSGQQLASLVGDELWITANFKETQLADMRPGQPVDISVDAFPGLVLHGRVDSFQAGTGGVFSLFPAENATGNFVKTVQRVPVKIALDAPPDGALPLGPGMSVVPTVHTGEL